MDEGEIVENTEVTILEGSARILKDSCTFFNPAQKLNRDLSVEVIKESFSKRERIRILDAMSATGLRGIRYLKEVGNSIVYFNDISESALQTIKRNILQNGVDEDAIDCFDSNLSYIKATDSCKRANAIRSDCNVLMVSLPSFFDVIDIDPFGSCSEYIDNAIRAIRHGGLLCFTATDKAVLCSNEKKCQTKYSTVILRKIGMNELPLRTIVSLVSRQASKFGASIEPVVSLSVDFYARVFIRVLKRNPKSVIERNSHVFFCKCYRFVEVDGRANQVNSVCTNCHGNMKLCGPFWNGPLHDKDLVQRILNALPDAADKRLVGVLRYLKQEIPTLFYYEIPRLCSILKINTIKQTKLMNSLANLNYSVSYTHSELNAIKTDAPLEVINRVLLLNHNNDEGGLDAGISFEENEVVKALEDIQFFKGLMKSGMGPLSLPKKRANTKQ